MKDLRHTPGPWKVSKNGNDIEMANSDNAGIATLYAISELQDKANAKLIAASPEMLEALKAMTEHYVDLVNSSDAGSWNPEEEDVVKKAREVITKATK